MLAKHIFTSGEAARLCGLSASTIKRWIQRGALRAFRTPGGDIRILKSDLLDFMRAYGVPLAPQLKPKPIILVAVETENVRCALRALIQQRALDLREAGNDFDLGCLLHKAEVSHVIIQSRPLADDFSRSAAIRAAVKPRYVRIGLVCDGNAPAPRLDRQRPEAIVSVQQENWQHRLLSLLLAEEEFLPAAAASQRRGETLVVEG